MKITIQTDADFTPKGARSAKTVQTRGVMGKGRQIRWYVSGVLYRRLPATAANVELTTAWLSSSTPKG